MNYSSKLQVDNLQSHQVIITFSWNNWFWILFFWKLFRALCRHPYPRHFLEFCISNSVIKSCQNFERTIILLSDFRVHIEGKTQKHLFKI